MEKVKNKVFKPKKNNLLMLDVFLAVFPIFSLILTGYILKNKFKIGNYFWIIADKVTYYLFFPSLLILELSHSNFSVNFDIKSIYVLFAVTILISVILFVIKGMFSVENRIFTSTYQGAIRFNSYVFIVCSEFLFGKESLSLASIFVSYMLVLTNVLSIIVLNKYGESKDKKNALSVLKSIFKNPLIIAIIIGLFLNFMGLVIPKFISSYMLYIGGCAAPMSIISIGAGLCLSYSYDTLKFITLSIILRLLLFPVLTIFGLYLLGLEGMSKNIAILYSCVSTSGNSYILAKEMGGDEKSMGSIITYSIVFSIITIPLFIYVVSLF